MNQAYPGRIAVGKRRHSLSGFEFELSIPFPTTDNCYAKCVIKVNYNQMLMTIAIVIKDSELSITRYKDINCNKVFNELAST